VPVLTATDLHKSFGPQRILNGVTVTLRTAERVGRQLDVPVITVSEDMSLVAIHRRGEKHNLEPIPRVLARADQALQILGRYKSRLDSVSGSLSALEVDVLRLYVEGKSYQEIGDQLGRHVKSIDNALQRIKRKLDQHLQLEAAHEAHELASIG